MACLRLLEPLLGDLQELLGVHLERAAGERLELLGEAGLVVAQRLDPLRGGLLLGLELGLRGGQRALGRTGATGVGVALGHEHLHLTGVGVALGGGGWIADGRGRA